MKKTYEMPKLEQLGSFEAMTQAATDGNNLDATFPITTPRGELTFS